MSFGCVELGVEETPKLHLTMLEATLEVQTRVFGADNPTTLNTFRMLPGLRAMLASD